MKKALLILASALSVYATAQNGLVITNTGNNAVVAPNSTVYMVSVAADNVKVTFDVKNTSGSTKSYHVKRYDMVLHHIGSDSARAYFCFAGNCYGKSVVLSQSALTLTNSQSASQVPGTFQMLQCDLDETTNSSIVGLSHVKYTIFNVANANDSVQFSIRYNDPVWLGLKVSDKDVSGMDIFPNPSSSSASTTSLRISSSKSFESKLTVYNSVGQAVLEKDVTIAEGRNRVSLQTENLPDGIYFVSLKTGTTTVTRKLIIN